MHTLNNCFLSENIVLWYEKNKRDLPWRHTKDPYLIWLSEIILQQTRVAQGLPYYLRFVEAFPTVKDFAEANEDEVLRLWQGLGYYSRGRNMLFTAQFIHFNLGGNFPNNYSDLQKLKGVGAYTAAAIASFAFNEAVAVLDGNVFRVLSRFYGINDETTSPKGKQIFLEKANEILPLKGSATHNQAIMEFGALMCSPVPHCESCPVNLECIAFQHNLQSVLPVKKKKLIIKNRFLYYFIFEFNNSFYLKKRTGNGIWQGLFEFYLVEKSKECTFYELIEDETLFPLINNSKISFFSEEFKHKLTHQNLSIWFVHIKLEDTTESFYLTNKENFYPVNEVRALPKPIVLANYFEKNHI